jgi:hypothetical protein
MTRAGRVGRRDELLQESIAAVGAESNRLERIAKSQLLSSNEVDRLLDIPC